MTEGLISVTIGDKRIWVSAYNPADALSLLYCRFVLAAIKEELGNVPVELVHQWLRSNVPGAADLLDKIEQGWELERDVPPDRFPMTPGGGAAEQRIIAELIKERLAQRAAARRVRP